mgnify:FL=1
MAFTSGDRALDAYLDNLRRRVENLERRGVATETIIERTEVQVAATGEVVVTDTNDDPYVVGEGLRFDDADGFAVIVDGNIARIDRAATTTTPADVAATAAAGTATKQANDDHTHAFLPWDFARLTAGNEALTANRVKYYVRVFDDAVTGRTLTLPAPASHREPIFVRALNAPAGGHTLARNGAENIDGAAAGLTMGTLATQVSEIGLVSDGSNWYSFYRKTL